MNARLAILCAFIVGGAAGFIAGCQTYDFEPVQPLALSQVTQSRDVHARNLKPNVMLLVDRSGSMDEPTNPTNSNCQLSDGGICGFSKTSLCDTNSGSPTYCATRWSELEGAMGDFLSDAGTEARWGLSIFPKIYSGTFGTCGIPPTADGGNPDLQVLDISTSNDVDSELQAQATAIEGALQAITSPLKPLPDGGYDTDHTTGGGTPTGPSLGVLGANPILNDPARANFVLLLTDGVPNCNPDNPNTGSSPACRCTLSSCPDFIGGLGCLDKDGTVAEITNLKAKNIRTIVIGFGAEAATGDGPLVLNAMAAAGGMARGCPDGGSGACGPGGTCDSTTLLCNPAYYQASNRAELSQVLATIGGQINPYPCILQLDAKPSDPALLSVLINGAAVPSGPDTWTYDPTTNIVTLQGSTCDQAKNTTATSPLKIEIRIVQGL